MLSMNRYNTNGRCCSASPMPSTCVTPIMPREPMCTPASSNITSLAVAFVINQPCGSDTYDLHTALCKGTIYPDLYKPYTGRGCR